MLLILSTIVVWGVGLWCAGRVLRGPGVVRRLRWLFVGAGSAGLGGLLAALLVILQAFQAFSGETLVARVTMRRMAPEEFELTYAPSDVASSVATVRLRGDQWAVSGGIVKWHPWLTALGLKSYHRPTRLAGQFAGLAQQSAHPPTVHSLIPDRDWLWERLYWLAPALPFIDAVYGSSAYAFVEPRATFELYVTPSGYRIKRKPMAP